MITWRIKSIAALVKPCDCICDIGCDHGFLPIHLVKENIVASAIAMDVAKGPLDSARKNVKEAGLSKEIKLRLSNGFEELSLGEADIAVIAGMGGNLMLDILKSGESKWKKMDAIILSPHRDDRLIREYMSSLCKYDTDTCVFEGNEFYTIMRFLPKESPVVVDDSVLYFGLNPSKDYLKYRKYVLNNILKSLSKTDSERAKAKEASVKKELLLLEERL